MSVMVAGFALAMLLPIAVTSFLGDDVFNWYINGAIGYGHQTFWPFVADLNATWIRNGRFFPGALVESYGLFHIIPSLAAYKIFQILITLANVVTFVVVLRRMGIPKRISQFGAIVLISILQMRDYHDGLLGFSGNIEFILQLTLLSVLALQQHLRRGSPWWLTTSLALYAIGLVTYEVTYLFWLAFFAIILIERPWQRAIKVILPYVILSTLVIGIQIYVKEAAHVQPDADYNVRLDGLAFFVTFIKQAIAAIPLTYVVIDPSSMFTHGWKVFTDVPPWILSAIVVLVATVTWLTTGSVDATEHKRILALLAVGCVLWITPSILVASSARYQRELVFGLGHVPVYIEYYGVAMCTVAFILYCTSRLGSPNRLARAALTIVVPVIATTTYASNAAVIATTLADKGALRNMDAALRSGLMRDIPAGAELYVDSSIAPNRYLHQSAADPKFFYFFETGARVNVQPIGELPLVMQCQHECRIDQTSYELINAPSGDAIGFVALGKLTSVATSRGQVRSFARDVKLFVRGTSLQTLWLQYTVHGCGPDRSVTQKLAAQSQASEMISLANKCGSVEMNALVVSASVPVQSVGVR